MQFFLCQGFPQAREPLAQRHDAAIIEDDVYGDIAYHYPRPRTIKSFDDDGRVLLCSSFSKTLAPGLRVGWIAPGRYLERVLHMKFIGSGATATQPQLAIAEFIRSGHYLQHLRRIRLRQGSAHALEAPLEAGLVQGRQLRHDVRRTMTSPPHLRNDIHGHGHTRQGTVGGQSLACGE